MHLAPRLRTSAAAGPSAALRLLLVAAFTCGFDMDAQAARPMITDDARLVDPRACQVESWARRNRDSTEFWALPSCNVTGNLELTFGGAVGRDSGGTRTTDVVLQGKTLLRRMEPNGWGVGLVLGNVRHPAINRDRNLLGDVYGYVPASFSYLDDRFVLHVNVGVLRDRHARRDRITWGIGSESQLSDRTWLIAETFGQNTGRPFLQIGVRHWIVPNHVQIDTTYGDRLGSATREHWFSVGLRWLSPAFLP